MNSLNKLAVLLLLLTSCQPVILRQTDGRQIAVGSIGVKYQRGAVGQTPRNTAQPYTCKELQWCNSEGE